MKTITVALSCQKSDLLSIFITNLGKYNEGELVGEWLTLPATPEQIQASLIRIGIDNIHYEEYFLTDYESPINGITQFINEYSDVNELNELACQLSALSTDDLDYLEAILEMESSIQCIDDLIQLTEKLDGYSLLPGVHNEEELGYYWIEESGCYDLTPLGNLANYLDYERFGRDIAIEQGGMFTDKGYISPTL